MLMTIRPSTMSDERKTINADKRARVAEALKDNPHRSDRVIAYETQTSQPTVFRVRKELEDGGALIRTSPRKRTALSRGSRDAYSQVIRSKIRQELLSDANRSSRTIAIITETSPSTVDIVRREMEQTGTIQHIPWRERAKTGEIPGGKVGVPDGVPVTQHVEAGMKVEAEKKVGIDVVAKTLGISNDVYRKVKAITLLSRRNDLAPEDMALVKATLWNIDRDRHVGRHWKLVAPIVERVWGPSSSHHGGSDRLLNKRKAVFDRAVALIGDTCVRAMEIDIPHLSQVERDDAADRLRMAARQLVKLSGKVRRGR